MAYPSEQFPRSRPWVGVDLDGTLAQYDAHFTAGSIGAPIPAMVRRVRWWLANRIDVRIVTARVAHTEEPERSYRIAQIGAWCAQHLGEVLPVTNTKDYAMIELFDDRVVAVEANTGRVLSPAWRPALADPPADFEPILWEVS